MFTGPVSFGCFMDIYIYFFKLIYLCIRYFLGLLNLFGIWVWGVLHLFSVFSFRYEHRKMIFECQFCMLEKRGSLRSFSNLKIMFLCSWLLFFCVYGSCFFLP